jgi:hypothetical protein
MSGERTTRPQYPEELDGGDCFGTGSGKGSVGHPGSDVGKPLGSAVGNPAGSGKPLGNVEGNGGSEVGNEKGGGSPASAPSCDGAEGLAVGGGRGVVGTGLLGVNVGRAVGFAVIDGVTVGFAAVVVDVVVAAGEADGFSFEGGSGGDELNASVPVPTKIPTTLAPRSRARPTRAGIDTPCRRWVPDVNPTGGAPAVIGEPVYAAGARAVAIGAARTVSTGGSNSGAPIGPIATGTASVLRKGVAATTPPMATVPDDGAANAGRAPVAACLPRTAPSSARRISVAVANRISGRAAIARCT